MKIYNNKINVKEYKIKVNVTQDMLNDLLYFPSYDTDIDSKLTSYLKREMRKKKLRRIFNDN